MVSFTTKQLRSQMGYFIQLLLEGKEVELNYHKKKVVVSNKNSVQQTQPNIAEVFDIISESRIPKKYQEAKDYKEIMNKYYEIEDFIS
jgi:hypothetical protein